MKLHYLLNDFHYYAGLDDTKRFSEFCSVLVSDQTNTQDLSLSVEKFVLTLVSGLLVVI
jgi:hypothetical protein